MKGKWENFSEEQLKNFALKANNFQDFGKFMGYSSFSRTKGEKLFLKYPFLLEILNNKTNLVGKRFGRLIVIEYSKEYSEIKNDKQRYWKCQCDCGNITYVKTSSLKNGNTQSCGCLHNETARLNTFKDLTGQIFGRLTVIKEGKRPENANNSRAYWWCKCSCGNPDLKLVQGWLLRNGHVTSCGCIQSQYEEKVVEILENNNIKYKRQYTFPDLVSNKNIPLRFDFAIFENNELVFLIEIQGQQHFKKVESWGGEEQLKITQEHDNKKLKYCQEKGIKLVILSYKDEINLKTLGLEEIKNV